MYVKLFARHGDSVGSLDFHVDHIRVAHPFIRLQTHQCRTVLMGDIFDVQPSGISIVVDNVLGSGRHGHLVNRDGRTPADL